MLYQLSYTPKVVPIGRLVRSFLTNYVSVLDYSTIFDTTPAPTVRPPSRIAKRSFSSIAIGLIRLTVKSPVSVCATLSEPSL